MIKQIDISAFTSDERDYLRRRCGFPKWESQLFSLRAEGYTIEQCAEMMNVSAITAYRINKKVKLKILKVIET